MGERLTIEEIKLRYPHQYVGLTNVEYHGSRVNAAVVKYTPNNISFDELSLKAIKGEVYLHYTTLEEDDTFMNIVG